MELFLSVFCRRHKVFTRAVLGSWFFFLRGVIAGFVKRGWGGACKALEDASPTPGRENDPQLSGCST